MPGADAPEVKRTADLFFKQGFREYREGNYLRARVQFETALQVDPTHCLSKLYLDNSNQAIDQVVEFHLDRGKRDFLVGKLSESKGHFESVIRLLHRDRSNAAYQEAEDQLKEVKKKIGEVK